MTQQPAVVVSGASTGIGLSTVELLIARGFEVFAGVRSDADAQRLAALDAKVHPLVFDVTDAPALVRARESVEASGASLVGVVANAGIALGGPLETLPIDDLRRQFEVNVFGAIAVAQSFLPLLPEQRGRVVFVGSISGRIPIPYIAPYSASKFALRALSDALRIELNPVGIGVTLIEPASVKTPIWGKGRAMAEALIDRASKGPRAHYLPAIRQVIAQTDAEERGGIAVEKVSSAIVGAIEAAKPPAHVLIGSAKIGAIIGMLPASLYDRFARATMKLP